MNKEREKNRATLKKLVAGCGHWLGSCVEISAIANNIFIITMPIKTVHRDILVVYAKMNQRGSIVLSDYNVTHDDFRFNGWGLSYARNVIQDIVYKVGLHFRDHHNQREIYVTTYTATFSDDLQRFAVALAALDTLMLFKMRPHETPVTPQRDE